PSVIRNKENASINLLNYDMAIYGVRQIYMSDSQNVVIYPYEQKIILKKHGAAFQSVVHRTRFRFLWEGVCIQLR
ncbi:MAG: hypothetical protein IPH89_12625, partial [Bacteroidetes bacterium]|nr:hypothetical protein [Bacteroidota bacterium]